MGKRSTTGTTTPPATSTARRASAERAAAARARVHQAQRRRRLLVVGASMLGVVAVIATLVVVRVVVGGTDPRSGQKATAASGTVTEAVTSVPESVHATVRLGTAKVVPTAVDAPALTADGKPEILYIGAEYCPYCAAERWAVTVALSRFGSFSGLGQTTSSPSDVYPSTATLTFHGASFRSSVLSFVARETQSNQVVDGQYADLDVLTPAQQAVLSKYDSPPYTKSTGGIPFIDIGGKYLVSGAGYDPGVLQGRTHAEIAAALADPSSPIARAVDGTANLLTAAICGTTGGRPSAVCTSPGVVAVSAELAEHA